MLWLIKEQILVDQIVVICIKNFKYLFQEIIISWYLDISYHIK